MPELMRAIAGRLRSLVGNRRRATRYKVRLNVSVSLHSANLAGANGSYRKSRALEGYTRDLSVTGLALIMPAIRIGEYYLTDQQHTLEIKLEVAAGQTLLLRAVPTRYEQLEGDGGEKGYLIGARLLKAGDLEEFNAYLKTL